MSEYLKEAHQKEFIETARFLELKKQSRLKQIAEGAKYMRSVYRNHRDGYTNDKAKLMRHTASFDPSIVFHSEYGKYFDKNHDKHERGKAINELLRKYGAKLEAQGLGYQLVERL